MDEPGEILQGAEGRRIATAATLETKRQGALGQFFSPASVAVFMASLFEPGDGPVRLLDPGAGVGSLGAAVVDRFKGMGKGPVTLTAVETDPRLIPPLKATMGDCERMAGAPGEVIEDNFLAWAIDRCIGFGQLVAEPFDMVVMNPPYRKIARASNERLLVSPTGVEVSNLYAAFLSLSVRLLRPGGQLVAITPRSFTNGPYFRSFRADFLQSMAFRRIHLYDTRDTAFADSAVLQENVIFHAIKEEKPEFVTISTSAGGHDDLVASREVPYEQVVNPADEDQFIHLVPDDTAMRVAARIRKLPGTLKDLECAVSTGRVVDFRARDYLRDEPGEDSVPLIYPAHSRDGEVYWPKIKGKKPNALARTPETEKLLLPNGVYVLVKRFSSKEERRRVVATISSPERVPGPYIAFENHLNVFHGGNAGLPLDVARGLSCYLNSTLVDLYFRQFNGHTQVNATDLRKLPYPAIEQLRAVGRAAGEATLSQEKVDHLLVEHVQELQPTEEVDPLMVHQRVSEAQAVLKALGLPRPQTNERSALTLLALLNLTPDRSWSDVEQPLMGITPMMDFMADHYGKRYAPNSRETVRRQTVHQFVSAGICVRNPDDPTRPVNSGNNVYQVPTEVIDLLKVFGMDEWEEALADYKELAQPLVHKWAAERDMARIPVRLPSGKEITLSPGGQNVLIKQVVEEFCSRFAPGGEVLYIGDADKKFAEYDEEGLAALGVDLGEHGKMPDLLVHRADKGWLLIVEAVTSHGPMDPKRHEELTTLFAGCKVPLVFITALPNRQGLRKYIADIAWETEVWVADAPSHLIHFDGEKFLGPHETA